jgi:hypothetical protein
MLSQGMLWGRGRADLRHYGQDGPRGGRVGLELVLTAQQAVVDPRRDDRVTSSAIPEHHQQRAPPTTAPESHLPIRPQPADTCTTQADRKARTTSPHTNAPGEIPHFYELPPVTCGRGNGTGTRQAHGRRVGL